MIDFTDFPTTKKMYSGANGNKKSIMYEGERYMLKFPSIAKLNDDMSYSNSCFSEYIGCHIFESVGLPTQKTILGQYKVNGNDKLVVACKDFIGPGESLSDFAALKNTVITSSRNGYGTELDDILSSIHEQTIIDSLTLEKWFWDMFIIDALIGNWDRHNGNWGFIFNDEKDSISLAPVFDCGSSLYPQADEKIMKSVLSDKAELEKRVYEIPLSAINNNGKKIRYFDFISSLEYKGCNDALKRMIPKIKMPVIEKIIDETPKLTDLQREFYKYVLNKRKELILDYSYRKIKDHKRLKRKDRIR